VKSGIYIIALILLKAVSAYTQTYYVAPEGAAVLSTDIAVPGDISYAFSNAPKHSTVYIKAGNYGNVQLTVANDSTSFIGYHNTPGDLTTADIPNSYSTFINNSTSFLSKYPVLDGNDRTTGDGIYINNKRNVMLRNFYIARYLTGVHMVSGQGHTVENIILNEFGKIAEPNNFSGLGIYLYNGQYTTIQNCFLLNSAQDGFTISGNNNQVLQCKAYSDDNSTGGISNTDYYFTITMGGGTSGKRMSRNNLIKDCYAERVGNLEHTGHGFCIVGFYAHKNNGGGCWGYDASYRDDSVCYNVVENCVANNIIGEVCLLRGTNTCYNEFINVRSLKGGGLAANVGAKFNTFRNCEIYDSHRGVIFVAQGFGDTTDVCVLTNRQGSYPWEQGVSAVGNKFINCLFNKVEIGIDHNNYDDFWNPDSNTIFSDRVNRKIIKDNDFINCTFIAKDSVTFSAGTPGALTKSTLFYAMRGNVGNRMINCLIYGFDRLESRWQEHSTSTLVVNIHSIIPTNYTYDHCNFYNNIFDAQIIANGTIPPVSLTPIVPSTNNTIGGTFINCNTLAPNFVNPDANDYRLSDCLTCGTIDKGKSQADMSIAGYGFITDDLDDNSRPCNDIYDIGAYEFQGNCIIVQLPVELVTLEGKYNLDRNASELIWTTASEINTNRFEIQKSLDAQNWTTIGNVPAKGAAAERSSYYFDDIHPAAGNNYYRLKIIDNDGSFEYSWIVTINVAGENMNNISQIYPNPTNNTLNVLLNSSKDQTAVFNVLDVLGRDITHITKDIKRGFNHLEFNFGALPSGAYILNYIDAKGEKRYAKFVKN
jgi:hypothetical protein